jgi:DNA-binding transcriptional LysR family regulator
MDDLEIRLLRAFPVLMRERSVSRAAERLGLSQPATSHLLARLRKLLHDPLLLRSRNGMVPTVRALEIEKSVQGLLDDYDHLTRLAALFDPRTSGRTFNISAPEFAERMVVPRLLRRIRREAPNVRVVVHTPASSNDRAFDLMERGELDLRIAWLIPAPVGSLRSLRLFHDRLVCIADRRHRSIRGALTLDQFLTLPHLRTLGYSQTTTGHAIDVAIAKRGRKIIAAQVVQSFVTMMRSIPGTDLIAIVPRLLAEDFEGRHQLQLLEPPLQLPAVRYSAYWHERNQGDAGHRWFRTTLAEAGRSVAS